jgi:tetratricopeptide (TPR) repeat protein
MTSTARTLTLALLLFAVPLARAQDTAPGAADSLFREGMRSYTAGRFGEAAGLFGALCDSATPNVVFYLAMSHLSTNNVQEGLPLLRRAVALDPANTGYRYQLAKSLAQSGSPDLAAAEYESLIAADSGFAAARYQLGLLRYEQRRHSEAAGLFRSVIDLNPGDYLSYYYLSSSLVSQAELDSARPYLASCMSLNPRYTPALTLLASIYYGAGEYDESLRLYSAAAAQRPLDPDLPYKIGLCYGKLGKIDSALAYCSVAARRDTTNDVYIAQAGYYHLVQERFDSALSAYRKAVQLDGENSFYYINLAFAFSRLNNADSAVAAYERGVAASHPENIATIYLRLGTLYYYQKEYRKALASYRQALDLQPLSTEAQYYVALAYDQLADPKTAVRQYRKYLALAKDDTTALERERKQQAGDRLRALRR